MINLDDIASVAATDRAGMLDEMAGFGDQCEQAVDIARRAQLPIEPSGIANIVVLGMGGSGISGDVCRVLFDDVLTVPLQVNRHYRLPAYVGPGTLVLAVSYSGNTEETLAALDEAGQRGAKAVCVSSGGKISQMAKDKGLPLVQIPAGLQPRAALGYLSLPPAVVLERLGLVPDLTAAVTEAVNLLHHQSARLRPQEPESSNPAKQLARRLLGRLPVIYGSEGVTSLAAFRFKCQINENAKQPANWNLLPELDHNEITGWQCLEDISRRFHLIFLRDAEEHPQVKKRVEVTRDLIIDQFCGADEFWSSGASKLARLLSLVYLGDFTSAYLALLNGVDPSPVERIELLKKRLA
ncbi:MAG: bifunctional phosphoglucose/phosphomannose isomerase [Actinomycetota bacterium]|nr:bifunctional phosphoglucose/phosphomannose isomerase [Actinomycetota bacterium]